MGDFWKQENARAAASVVEQEAIRQNRRALETVLAGESAAQSGMDAANNALSSLKQEETRTWRSREPVSEELSGALQTAASAAEEARRGVRKVDYVKKNMGKSYEDNFLGQIGASYAMGRMSQDEAMAWSEYLSKPTEENRAYAQAVGALMADTAIRNRETLDADATLPWLSQSLAGYAPQFLDQQAAGIKGGLSGAAIGTMAAGPAGTVTGAKIGYMSGRANQGFEVMQGAAFKQLLDAGVPEDIARKAAKDEGFVNSLLEAADAGVDLMTLGGGKLLKTIFKGGGKVAAGSALGKAAKILTGYGINILGEGAQEYVQEGVSIANRERALEGRTGQFDLVGASLGLMGNVLTGKDSKSAEQMTAAGIEGMKIAAMAGGAQLGGNTLAGHMLTTGREAAANNSIDRAYGAMLENGPFSQEAKAAMDRADRALGPLLPTGANSQTIQNLEDGQKKAASTGEAGAYRAVRPENVELPTVPIINLSMDDVAELNRGVLPDNGGYLRRTATARARERLGLDKSSEAYIPASNVLRNGEEYMLKITKASLDKMFSPSDGSKVPPETVAVVENLERIANNGVFFRNEGDRRGRDSIQGVDHLMTTVYIDGQPYVVDMRVRIVQRQAGDTSADNVLYYLTPEEINAVKKADGTTPAAGRHASDGGAEPSSDNRIAQGDSVVNGQYMQESGINAGEDVVSPTNQTEGAHPDDSTGAAPVDFDPYSHFQNQKGEFHPDGEKAFRQVDLPTTDMEGRNISKSAATVMEAQTIPDEMVGEIERMVLDGKFSYAKNTDRGAMARAEQSIQSIGWNGAVERFHQAARDGKASKDLMALGATLLNNAANSRDGKTMALILADYSSMSRAGAQATQANRLLKKMSPQWQLAAIQRTVDDLNTTIRERESRKVPGAEVPVDSGTGLGGVAGPDSQGVAGGKSANRDTTAKSNNIPVEEWMRQTGVLLAKKLEKATGKRTQKTQTTVDTILGDLYRFAREHMQSKQLPGGPKRTNMDRIQDLFDNYDNYQEAWDSAKDTIRKTFGEDPAAMAALEEWMGSALDYGKALTVELTGQDQIRIAPELVDRFLVAKSQSERDTALDAIYQNVADQVPSTWMDKWNAWRYLAMLGNFRTHVRNIVGNAGFAPVRMAKNEVGALLERAVGAVTGGKVERTKSFVVSPELYKAALDDFSNVREQAMGGRKFDDMSGQIQDRRTIFKLNGEADTAPKKLAGALLTGAEYARKLNSKALDMEDALFSRAAYADSLAGFLKARGVTAKELKGGAVDSGLLDKARTYAIREAQKATYRDSNAFSDWVSKLGGQARRSDHALVRGIGVLGEGILPFKKTPANILARGVEYGPVGLVKGAVETVQSARNGGAGMAGALDSLASGLTGTGIFALGALLASAGIVSGGGSGDEDKDRFDDLTGKQNYSMRLKDGTWVTLDWLAPEALPFFMGVEYSSLGAENGFRLKDLWEAGKNLTDPLLEMSMLQSLNDILSKRGYQDTGLGELAVSALSSYLTQGLPTLAGQAERTTDAVRTSTYADKNGQLPTGAQYVLGKVGNKIPGWDYQQIPYIDAWGRTESSGGPLERGISNFLNPAFTSKENITPLDKELLRLYEQGGDGGVFPDRAEKYIQVSGSKVDLDKDQYVQYATEKGETAYKTASAVADSSLYAALSESQKGEVVRQAYQYADQTAKKALGVGYVPDDWVLDGQKLSLEDRAEYLVMKVLLSDAGGSGEGKKNRQREALLETEGLSAEEKAQMGMSILGDARKLNYSNADALAVSLLPESTRAKAETAFRAGIEYGVFVEAYEAQKGIKGETGPLGKPIKYSEDRNKKNAVDQATQGLTVQQRRKLYELLGISQAVWGMLPVR